MVTIPVGKRPNFQPPGSHAGTISHASQEDAVELSSLADTSNLNKPHPPILLFSLSGFTLPAPPSLHPGTTSQCTAYTRVFVSRVAFKGTQVKHGVIGIHSKRVEEDILVMCKWYTGCGAYVQEIEMQGEGRGGKVAYTENTGRS